MTAELITRRAALTGIMGTGGLILSGCDKLSQNQTFQRMLEGAEKLNLTGQRLVLNSSTPLAREYQKSDISRVFKANGTVRPDGAEYRQLASAQFETWKLQIGGLVNKPLSFSLEELKSHALAHPDHAARLRRGLERDRAMDGRAALLCSNRPS